MAINYRKKFLGLESIYNINGDLKDSKALGFKEYEDFMNALEKARSKGYGSIKSPNGNEYTLYAKYVDDYGNDLLVDLRSNIPEAIRERFDRNKYIANSAQEEWLKARGKIDYEPSTNWSVVSALKEPLFEHEYIPTSDTENLYKFIIPFAEHFSIDKKPKLINNKFNISNNSTKDTYKSDSLYRNILSGEAFNDNNFNRYLNRYYGADFNRDNNDTMQSQIKSDVSFIINNANLRKDRANKGIDYIPMESSRLNRTVGKYAFTYRDMLNYFKNNLNVGNLGKYSRNNDKFMQELYELGASRNGMLEHELKRLFGEGYDEILRNLESNLKYGGALRMLFI